MSGRNDVLIEVNELSVRNQIEKHRNEIPDDVFRYFDAVEIAISQGRSVEVVERGLFSEGLSAGQKIGKEVLTQLEEVLCSSEHEADDVREHGRVIADALISVVGGKVAAVLGISTAVATAASGIAILMLTRAGIGLFCKACEAKEER